MSAKEFQKIVFDQLSDPKSVEHRIRRLAEFLLELSPKDLLDLARGTFSASKVGLGDVLGIDLMINFPGILTYGDPFFLNCMVFPHRLHRLHEQALLRIFGDHPELRELIYQGTKDSDMPFRRENYHRGPNWRMSNLLMSGYFDLYYQLIDSRIRPSHFYYLVFLLTLGTSPDRDDRHSLFIPVTYHETVLKILGRLYCLAFPEKERAQIYGELSNSFFETLERNVSYVGHYEYYIFVMPKGGSNEKLSERVRAIRRERGIASKEFCDPADATVRGIRLDSAAVIDLLRQAQCGKEKRQKVDSSRPNSPSNISRNFQWD
jgi:hypothetical protein